MARTPSGTRDCEQNYSVRITRLLIEIYTTTTPNVTLSWEEGTSKVEVASGDREIITPFSVGNPSNLPQCKTCAINQFPFRVLSFGRPSSSRSVSTPDEQTRDSISPPNSTRDSSIESDTPTVTPSASPVKFSIWFDRIQGLVGCYDLKCVGTSDGGQLHSSE